MVERTDKSGIWKVEVGGSEFKDILSYTEIAWDTPDPVSEKGRHDIRVQNLSGGVLETLCEFKYLLPLEGC